jgi:hypothetical protein
MHSFLCSLGACVRLKPFMRNRRERQDLGIILLPQVTWNFVLATCTIFVFMPENYSTHARYTRMNIDLKVSIVTRKRLSCEIGNGLQAVVEGHHRGPETLQSFV